MSHLARSGQEGVRLWAHIRRDQLGVSFRRQHAIGSYVPDFVCTKRKLIIELDGSQHLEQTDYDRERTAYFESIPLSVTHLPPALQLLGVRGWCQCRCDRGYYKGYRVLRFWNHEVTDKLESVLTVIWDAIQEQRSVNDG